MRFLAALLAVAALALAGGCTTVDVDMQRQQAPQEVEDDRPMASWNRLLRETLPVVRRALVNEPEPFYPRGFVLSRLGGVRSVHISPRAGDDHEDRLNLIFESIRVMTRGDDIVAFVVYATGEGQLLDTRDRSQMVVAHMEHQSGRALLRRLSYEIEDGAVSFGPEDVNSTDVLIMESNKESQ